MSNELIREKIVLDKDMGREVVQVLIEGDIIVPDVKPDMAVMLQADSKISIDKVQLSSERINYMGKLSIQVLYLAKGNDKPVHSMFATTPIDDFINFEGITKDMWVDVKADIQNIDYKMINDRKISYKAVAMLIAEVESSEANDIIVHIDNLEHSQQKKNNLSLNKAISRTEGRFNLKELITVSMGKPNIREILQTNINVLNQNTKVMNSKVNIYGELMLAILYRGDTDASVLEFVEAEIPFNETIDVQEAREDMFADIFLNIQDSYIQVRSDDDGEERVIEAEVSVGAKIKISSQVNIEILEDAYCTNRNLEITKDTLEFPKLICRNKNQSNFKELTQLESHSPDMLQIFRAKGKAIVDETTIINDKVIVSGVVETDILYIAENDDTPLYSHNTMIPFRQVIETKGATPNMNVYLDASVEHVGFNMLSGREVELRFLINFNTSVIEYRKTHMITNVEFAENNKELMDAIPSISLYVVQDGDSLWNIAKMHNTTIEEIIALNDIENHDLIYPGQKILILKKANI